MVKAGAPAHATRPPSRHSLSGGVRGRTRAEGLGPASPGRQRTYPAAITSRADSLIEGLTEYLRQSKDKRLIEHDKSILPGLTARRSGSKDGILGHAQIIKDASDISGEPGDGGGDAGAALGFDRTSGKAAQAYEVFWAVAGA